jgi:hypothetical protein
MENMEMDMLDTALKVSPRDVMERISQRLGAVLGDSKEPILAFVIDNQVAVNVAVDGDRLSVFCRIADVSQMSPSAWVAMLTEAALMWSEPATDPDAMLERLQLVMSRAVAVARMVRRLKTSH